MDGWLTFTYPAFRLGWRCPAVTPLGHPVEVVEEQRDDFHRVHLLAPAAGEVYFEVRRFAAIAPEAEHARHTAYLAERFAVDNFAATPLTLTTLAGLPAHTYGFRWKDNERAVVLVSLEGALYRIIYDPRSEVNEDILASVSAR